MPLETVVVTDDKLYDILIIGAGPAGLTSAIYGARSGLKTAFIEKSTPGGKIIQLKNITNFPGVENIRGTDLASSLYKQAIDAGARYLYGSVSNVLPKLGYLAVYCDDGNTWFGKTVIICTGTENTKLNIPGEKQYENIGVSYCTTCDGNLAKGKAAVVIGESDEACSAAIYMSTIASKTTLINRGTSFSSRKLTKEFVESKGVKIIMSASPIEITGDTYNVEKLILRDNESGDITNLKADFIFVEIGYSPATTFLSSKILSETKIVSVNPTTRETNIPGLYAAGDVSKDVDRQIVTATSDGAIAAMNAIKYVKEDFEQARKNATNV